MKTRVLTWRICGAVLMMAPSLALGQTMLSQDPGLGAGGMGGAVQHHLDLSAQRIRHHSATKVSAPADAIVTS